jgi:hypothetical protein
VLGEIAAGQLTWTVQPADTRTATVAASVIAVAGSLAYALLGSRR